MTVTGPKIRSVGESHYVVGSGDSPYGPIPSKRLPADAQHFWLHEGLGESNQGVIATVERHLVGFFRFAVDEEWLIAGGTWVDPQFRKRHLATTFWVTALKHNPSVKKVDVVVASEGGQRLIQRVERIIKDVQFDING